MAADLVIVGDCNPDVLVLGSDVIPEFGQREKLVNRISLVVGGSAAIMAVAAARLGVRVALVAAVGDDPAGRFMLGQLAAEGVDVTAVAMRAGVPTGMTVALSHGDDRAILTATGAVASLAAADVPQALVHGARHLHVSSYFLIEPSLGDHLGSIFAAARTAGVTTSLDTNWDPADKWGGERLRSVLAQTDLLIPNEAEALRIAGRDTLPEAVGVLAAAGSRLVVKRGSRGALCVEDGRRHSRRGPAGSPGRRHRSRRLLQRRPHRRAAARPGPAGGGRARLRRGCRVHTGTRGNRQRPGSGRRARQRRDRHHH